MDTHIYAYSLFENKLTTPIARNEKDKKKNNSIQNTTYATISGDQTQGFNLREQNIYIVMYFHICYMNQQDILSCMFS